MSSPWANDCQLMEGTFKHASGEGMRSSQQT